MHLGTGGARTAKIRAPSNTGLKTVVPQVYSPALITAKKLLHGAKAKSEARTKRMNKIADKQQKQLIAQERFWPKCRKKIWQTLCSPSVWKLSIRVGQIIMRLYDLWSGS